MRVWAKNQLRFEIFEKFFSNLHAKISMENYFFIDFFSHLPGLFHFIHLWNIPKFLAVACGVGYFWPGLGGGTFEFGGRGLYKSLPLMSEALLSGAAIDLY